MSLNKNIIAGYASQLYITVLGVITLPFYIKYMGAETFGLIGFFTLLQSWFNLLDFGLTPTIARETAKFKVGGYDSSNYLQLFRALNLFFLCIAVIGGIILFLITEYIAHYWLKIQNLTLSEVVFALQIMAISVVLRWMTGLYRGVISGHELLVWLSGFNTLIASLRFLAIFPILWTFGNTPTIFFSFQLLVVFVEFIGLFFKSKSLLPHNKITRKLPWSIEPIKNVLQFSLSIALTSGLWILVTQTDKLIMSSLLSLEQYGYFTLAIVVASGIMLISAPISSAITPRMTKLYEEGKNSELISLYKTSTQLATLIAGSITIILAGFSKSILFLWTNNIYIAQATAPILTLYAIGYGILVVTAFPYYLQYAIGKLNLHIIGSVIYIIILMPLLFWLTQQYGMYGAGYSWLTINIIYLIGYTHIVHNKYIPKQHFDWLFNDIFIPLTPSILVILVTRYSFNFAETVSLLQLSIISITILAVSLLSNPITNKNLIVIKYFRNEKSKQLT